MESGALEGGISSHFSRAPPRHACEGFLNTTVKSRDTVRADEGRRAALAPAEKDYPCILLTLVIIYLLHIIFALLWLSASRFWLCCKAIALLHRGGIYCPALLEIQMYYYEAAVSGWLCGGGRTCVSLKPSASPPLPEQLPAPRHLVVWGL